MYRSTRNVFPVVTNFKAVFAITVFFLVGLIKYVPCCGLAELCSVVKAISLFRSLLLLRLFRMLVDASEEIVMYFVSHIFLTAGHLVSF